MYFKIQIFSHGDVNINFNLTDAEQNLISALKHKIVEEIAGSNGKIRFSQFMNMALYDPVYGYYNNLLHKFGEHGDFVTAPLVSGLFAHCLLQQIIELWQQFVIAKVSCNILEVGAGNGRMMLDLLSLMCQNNILFEKYYVLELSGNLIQLQKKRIMEEIPEVIHKVEWVQDIPDGFEGVIIANEVLDALPCEIALWEQGGVKQRFVGYNNAQGAFYYDDLPATGELLKNASKLPPFLRNSAYVSEINLVAQGFMTELACQLHKGAILIIDYGYGADEYYSLARKNGTLRGFFRHQQLDELDILNNVGLIDITASVNFSGIVEVANDNGLELVGYTSQAGFLINCGLLNILERALINHSQQDYLALTNQVNRLTSPNEMGEIFKCLGLSKGIDFCEWLGFRDFDRCYTL